MNNKLHSLIKKYLFNNNELYDFKRIAMKLNVWRK